MIEIDNTEENRDERLARLFAEIKTRRDIQDYFRRRPHHLRAMRVSVYREMYAFAVGVVGSLVFLNWLWPSQDSSGWWNALALVISVVLVMGLMYVASWRPQLRKYR